MQTLLLVFIAAAFVYPFCIYPLLLKLLVRRKHECLRESTNVEPLPTVAMVVCALNERHVIRQKIENCLQLNYPPGQLRLIFISDGSTDGTAGIIREYVPQGVECIERTERVGKVANLNAVIPQCREEVVILSDANVIYDSRALLELVAPFADDAVGCVSGKVVLTDTTVDIRSAEQDYYSLEWDLQSKESDLYSMVGVDGAMYAIRRELFCTFPNDTLIEDFVISMGVVRQGKRVVLQPKALAWESGPKSLREEFRRRVRMAAGAAQALLRGNGWPKRCPTRFWFAFISHKLLRWVSPLLGVIGFAIALASWTHPVSQLILLFSGLLVGLVMVRILTGWRHPLLEGPFYFVFVQTALGFGFAKGLAGRQSVLWAKANR